MLKYGSTYTAKGDVMKSKYIALLFIPLLKDRIEYFIGDRACN